MKTKRLLLSVFTLFALILISEGVNALPQCLNLAVNSIPTNVSHNQGSFDVSTNLTIDSNCNANRTGITWAFTSNIPGMAWTTPTITAINVDEVIPVTLHFTFPSGHSGTINNIITLDSTQDDAENFSLPAININNAPSLQLQEITPLTYTQQGVVNVTNNGNVELTNVHLVNSGSVGGVTFNPISFNLGVGVSQLINVNSTFTNLQFGNNQVILTAQSNSANSSSITWTIPKTFCKNGEKGGNLTITSVRIDNEGQGDDNEWQLLDVIELKVKVENGGNDRIKDVVVKLGLLDSAGRNKVGDLQFENSDEEEIGLGSIGDGSDETATFRFSVPADVGEGSYKLAIKTYSGDLGESVECSSTSSDLSDTTFESIDVQSEEDEGKYITFQNIQLIPTQATCGEKIILTTDVFNVGSDSQDQVKVTLFNKALGINQNYEIRKNLDVGEKETVSFEFEVPQNAEEKKYDLELRADYDYRSGNYRQSSDESTLTRLNVAGCTVGQEQIATINAILASAAKPGEELLVKVTVTNKQNKQADFILDVQEYESWASLEDISSRAFTLDAGKSKEITLKFKVNTDAEGEKNFIVSALSEGKTEENEIAVNIEKASTTTGGGLLASLGGNSFLWIVGAINVILIVVIIIVAVRISTRR